MQVKTVDGIVYTINQRDKIITGGMFRTPTKFLNARFIVGMPGWVLLPNHQEIEVAVVECYVVL